MGYFHFTYEFFVPASFESPLWFCVWFCIDPLLFLFRFSDRHGRHFIERCGWKRWNSKLYQWQIVRLLLSTCLFIFCAFPLSLFSLQNICCFLFCFSSRCFVTGKGCGFGVLSPQIFVYLMFSFYLSSCWLSSTNNLIWIFVAFVALIEVVSFWGHFITFYLPGFTTIEYFFFPCSLILNKKHEHASVFDDLPRSLQSSLL